MADIDYVGAAMADRTWAPEPEKEEREGFALRAPKSLLARARAAAEAETLVREHLKRPGEVSINGMVVLALTQFLDAYEKEHGALPAAKAAPKRPSDPENDSSPMMVKYAAGVAKKRQAREN